MLRYGGLFDGVGRYCLLSEVKFQAKARKRGMTRMKRRSLCDLDSAVEIGLKHDGLRCKTNVDKHHEHETNLASTVERCTEYYTCDPVQASWSGSESPATASIVILVVYRNRTCRSSSGAIVQGIAPQIHQDRSQCFPQPLSWL